MAKNGTLMNMSKNHQGTGNGYMNIIRVDDGRNYLGTKVGTKDARILNTYKHHMAPQKEKSDSMSLRIKPSKGLLEDAQKRILLKEYNPENLLHLLHLVSPDINLDDLHSDEKRVSAMKRLMINVHPSNYPNHEDAQSLYEDIQTFYDACCQRLTDPKSSAYNGGRGDQNAKSKNRRKLRFRRSSNSSPTTVIETVVQFNVRQKWPWLDGYLRPLCPEEMNSGKTLSPLVAYQCINARGAIAHGKRPSLIYSWENAASCTGLSVMEVFSKHGGYKSLPSGNIEEIKLEIIHHGPVVSFSFTPTREFAGEHQDSILKSRIKKHHYCLIVGWKLTEFGEVWLVQSYNGRQIMEVPVGQFSIDDNILAPKDDFVTTCWQQGPHFDRDMGTFAGWFQYESITLLLKSIELEEFAEVLGSQGFHEAISKKVRFVIRDKKKQALSRSCVLTDVKWNKASKVWQVTCEFNGSSNPLTPSNTE